MASTALLYSSLAVTGGHFVAKVLSMYYIDDKGLKLKLNSSRNFSPIAQGINRAISCLFPHGWQTHTHTHTHTHTRARMYTHTHTNILTSHTKVISINHFWLHARIVELFNPQTPENG